MQNTPPPVEIEIDGQRITTPAGRMIIQVADEHGIYIPRFCYHKKLSVAANCRMCLVEVEKAPKTLPACATPVNDGMKVFTQSAKTLESQRAVMEFLLINHPLDCPICDQGGQCELQDFSLTYGKDHSDYQEEKRVVSNDDFGPLIATHMTRCIHCTRCVRFGKEIAGVRELGATGRGEHMQISTYVKHTIDHELSGNMIDLCPVGALLSKPFLYQARAWELNAIAGVAPHDGLGSNIMIHTRRHRVMRVTPKDNDALNESWLSDRDRFSYQGLEVDRLEKPMMKDKASGEWREVSWSIALNYVADALEKIQAVHGADSIATILSPNSTLEEAYLLKRLSERLNTGNIDYRLRRKTAIVPQLNMAVADIEQQKTIVIVGSHLRNDQPLLAHRVRKAALNGAKVHVIDSVRHSYAFNLASESIVKPSDLLAVVKVAGETFIENSSLIIMGELALSHPAAEQLYTILSNISQKTQSTLAVLSEGANALGCHRIGAWVPHDKHRLPSPKGYILHGIEPEYDVANPAKLERELLSADIVVAVTPFISEHLKQCAHVLLPSAAFTETSGTYINLAGDVQSFMGSVLPKGEARPAWKIYRVLGNLLNITDFVFESSEDILRAIPSKMMTESLSTASSDISFSDQTFAKKTSVLVLEQVTWWPDCRSDNLVRRAKALNDRKSKQRFDAIHIHPETARMLNLTDHQSVIANEQICTQVSFNEDVAVGVALIAGGVRLLRQLGEALGFVQLKIADNQQDET
ncbi:MAG: NADH-quinone oxidoreductase subunit NuoG [Gammaproteobacteria bacterium]|nr:NADH-quinone oxidoreductase subunit NuoG [Gammaproteobacteria bacterium]